MSKRYSYCDCCYQYYYHYNYYCYFYYYYYYIITTITIIIIVIIVIIMIIVITTMKCYHFYIVNNLLSQIFSLSVSKWRRKLSITKLLGSGEIEEIDCGTCRTLKRWSFIYKKKSKRK
jgi:hypothetical protein